jgi:hypothetical protein
MHPDDRPQTIEQFAQALFGRGGRPAGPVSLGEALRANWFAVFLAISLFVLALLVTLI